MEELIRFLTEYTEMFEKMEQKQVEKLGLLMTKELDKIEESIMMQQAMDKQLQNMEQRRQELFEKAGLNGKTLQEVAELCGGEERKQLTDLYRRLVFLRLHYVLRLRSRRYGRCNEICGNPSITRIHGLRVRKPVP